MSDAETPLLVLASASPRRLALLRQVGVDPDRLEPQDLDETPKRRESPRDYARRLSREKAQSAYDKRIARNARPAYILAADTVVSVGRRILPKTETLDEAEACLELLSGRAHRVTTGLTIVTPKGTQRTRLVETRVRFKRLSRQERELYLECGEWEGKAGGYAIQGRAAAFVVNLQGSYPNVVGLPVYESLAILQGEGLNVLERQARFASEQV